MIGKLAKAVLKLILPDVTEHLLRIFKLEKVLAYVELPNEADKGVEKLKVANEILISQVSDLVNDVNKLKNIVDKVKKIRSL